MSERLLTAVPQVFYTSKTQQSEQFNYEVHGSYIRISKSWNGNFSFPETELQRLIDELTDLKEILKIASV